MFTDRVQAGFMLGRKVLKECPHITGLFAGNTVVLGIVSGGLPIGYELALALNCAFDVIFVRKVAVPEQPGCFVGRISSDDILVTDTESLEFLSLPEREFNSALSSSLDDARSQETKWRLRSNLPKCDLRDRTCIIVDDGSSTGLTALAAIRSVKTRGAARTIFAAPAISARAEQLVSKETEQIITLARYQKMISIADFYIDYAPVPEENALAIMSLASKSDLCRKQYGSKQAMI